MHKIFDLQRVDIAVSASVSFKSKICDRQLLLLNRMKLSWKLCKRVPGALIKVEDTPATTSLIGKISSFWRKLQMRKYRYKYRYKCRYKYRYKYRHKHRCIYRYKPVDF